MKSIFSQNGYAVELRNCAEEAGMAMREHNGSIRTEINRLIESGRFVIVELSPWHCRSTDAVVGNRLSILSHFPSREEAQAYLSVELAKIMSSENPDYDLCYEVWPQAAPVAQVEVQMAGEEIPF